MDCIEKVCNCEKNCDCGMGYTCCSQETPDGKAEYGLCVKDDNCDKKRGLPLASCKNPGRIEKIEHFIRQRIVPVKEGYNDNSDCWVVFVAFVSTIVATLLIYKIAVWILK
jgi:hypothetical protein